MAAGTSIIARASRNLVNYASLLWNSTARTMKERRAGRSRVSQVLKAGRGRKKRRRRRGEKEGKKGEKERRIGKHVVGREILRKLGTRLNRSDGGRVFLARFIDSVSARTNYGRFALPPVLSNGVPKLAAPLRSTRQSLSSEKKEKKKGKQLESFPFSLSLSLSSSSTTINLFSAPFSHFRTSLEIEPGFDQEGSQLTIRYSRIVERRRRGKLGQVFGPTSLIVQVRGSHVRFPAWFMTRQKGIQPDREVEWIIFETVWTLALIRGILRSRWKSSSCEIRNTCRWMEQDLFPIRSSRYFGKETFEEAND